MITHELIVNVRRITVD